MTYWRGKRAVITGGSAGLGRAIAATLVDRGARVLVVARSPAKLDETAAYLKSRGGDVLAVSADVTVQADVDRLAATVREAWGGLDMFCHCAGRSMRGTILTTSTDDFRHLWETNFLSALRCTQAFANSLAESRGHLVLIGSLASKVAAGYLGAYPSSKFPLAALAQQLRLEQFERGLHTLLVCPGPIARDDADSTAPRYASQAPDVPPAAQQPGGGAKVRAIEARKLAEEILRACERRKAELVVPWTARYLFAATQLSPRFGDWLLKRMTSG